MDTEFEAKFYPVNKDEFRQKLLNLGAILIHPERRMYRALSDKRCNPSLKCSFLRVRDEGGKTRLSAKIVAQKDSQLSDQKEVDVIVDDFNKTIEILKLAGLSIDLLQESLRETWKFNTAEIVIDTWPGLEPYSEIEASSESEVKQLAGLLGFRWDKKILVPPLEIFAEKYHLSIDETWQKMSNISFSNNPFAGLPSFPVVNSQPSGS
jgi:adenylate cyclase, class 2